MTTCILVAAVITCSDVRPTTPAEAVRVLTASVPAFVPSPVLAPRYPSSPVAYDKHWPFVGPISHRPLSPPQWTSVTTYVPRFGPPRTVFDGGRKRGR